MTAILQRDQNVHTPPAGNGHATAGLGGRIGRLLIDEGVIDQDLAQRADQIQKQHPDRHLGQILVRELGVDHHAVFSRLTRVYGFKEYDFDHEAHDETRVEFVRKFLQRLPDKVRERAIRKRVVPLKVLHTRQEVLLVVTPDPTDRQVRNIATDFGYRRPEIYYGRPDALQVLLDAVLQTTNEFLEELAEATPAPVVDDTEEMDDADIDAEIHRGMLTNLVEGALLEAVRQGASDIHIIPFEGNRTELHFRIDGDLQRWYTQEGVKPESVLAVVKDRARGVDRFQRDRAQDGFMQREIDGHLIRYRVSVMPISGTRPQRRFESIVIRVLDDRNVITELDKLGLQPEPLAAFKRKFPPVITP